jgi:hypothetical protein
MVAAQLLAVLVAQEAVALVTEAQVAQAHQGKVLLVVEMLTLQI